MHIYFGAHTSIAGGVLNGLKYITSIGGNVSQIFLGNKLSAQLKMKTKISDMEKKEIKQYLHDNDMKLFVHASYILNLASKPPTSQAIQYQLDSLRYDLELGDEIGSSGLVIHLGNMMKLDEEEAYHNMAACVMKVIDNSKGRGRILLETSAGAGTQIGVGLKDFARLWGMFPKSYHSRLGICVDTAHIFSAGIEINKSQEIKKYFVDFNHLIGIKHLCLVHLNDSKAPLNARVDRHESLTKGYIFNNEKGGDVKALQTILNFLVKYHIPALLETPEQSNYQFEIELIKSMVHSYMKLPKPSINLLTQSLRTKINRLTRKAKNIKQTHKKQSAGMSTFANIEPNKKIIRLLMELGDLLKIEKDFFRSRALQTASIILREYDQKIENAEQLKGISRIGHGIRDKVREILETGTMEELEMLRRRGPQKKSMKSSIMEELQGVLGIGPQEAKRLLKMGVKSIEDLETKVANGMIELNHQQMIGLKYRKDLNIDIPRKDAHKIVMDIKKIVNLVPMWKDLEIIHAGSYPSGKVASKDIDILMFDPRIKTREDLRKSTVLIDVVKFLEDKGKILETLSLGSTKFLGIVPPLNTKKSNYAMHLDIRLIPTESRVPAYFFYTSGGKFNQMIRQVAKDKGFMLSEFELKDKTGKKMYLEKEEDIFTTLGIDFIPMEDRRAI
jgi:apurinic endonuclease APN1